jgi:hypothetical protein
MSPSTDSLPALSVLTVAQWKTQLTDEAFTLNAYGILMGTETAPASSADARTKADYSACKSSLIGLMHKSLDMAQKQTVLANVDILDAQATYEALLAAYEPKTSASRVAVIQELLALRKKDEERYASFGSRALEIVS